MSASVITVTGRVVPGDRRGRTLGFPTANISMSAPVPGLKDGVWAAIVVLDGSAHIATVSIGHRPTFYAADGERLLEAFLLDFDGDLYDQQIAVELRHRIRPQRRFADADELIARMEQDVTDTRTWASSPRGVTALARRSVLADERRRQKRTLRAVRTEAAIARAAGELAGDALTHEAVARRANAPVGLVRWTYPTVDDLTRAAG